MEIENENTIENENPIENGNTIENSNKTYEKNKRLYLSWIMTIMQFVAMSLQIIKYGTSGKAMVSGWTKLIQNIICGTIMIYLKWSSYDNELNNKFHLIIFTARRVILLGGFIFLVYTDSKNDFESFEF